FVLLLAAAWLMFAQPKTQFGHLDGNARHDLGSDSRSDVLAADFTAGLPFTFEQNEGQTDSRVKFLSRQGGADMFLLPAEARLHFRDAASQLQMKFVGANRNARVKGFEPLPGHQNYLLGNNPAKWQTNVPTFRKVVYEGIYPQTDLIFY